MQINTKLINELNQANYNPRKDLQPRWKKNASQTRQRDASTGTKENQEEAPELSEKQVLLVP